MRIIADLHIHSRYSRATSQRMSISEIARFAKMKGLNIIGTGDFTHPLWFREIQEKLVPEPNTDLHRVADKPNSNVRFMLTAEVCTVFNFKSNLKKIHHVVFTPNLETATQIIDVLGQYGNLTSDGRPILKMSAPHLVEEIMKVSSKNLVFPAHVWTPWFSALGAFSGFDSIEECYQDMTKHIYALETGLSSDPPMNWRLSQLDKFTLVSNSDCHSFWPWRIGREANVFELERITYHEIVKSIREKDPARFRFTIETDPAYGKYHWTGHRKCDVSLSSQDAEKFSSICPVCHRKLTKGVEQRLEELADRPADFQRKDVPGFMRLLPLSEIVATTLGASSPSTQAVWRIYNLLIGKFGDEYTILIDSSKDALAEVVDEQIADAIIKVRTGSVRVVPGYDGIYGKLVLGINGSIERSGGGRIQQTNLADFFST